MDPKEKFVRVVRYLSARGNQVFVDQINQPAIGRSRDDLPGQRLLFYVAIVMILVAGTMVVWLFAQ